MDHSIRIESKRLLLQAAVALVGFLIGFSALKHLISKSSQPSQALVHDISNIEQEYGCGVNVEASLFTSTTLNYLAQIKPSLQFFLYFPNC